MRYIVDPQVILDSLKGHSDAGKRALALLTVHLGDELILVPTSYLALAPAFMGVRAMEDRFLEKFGIRVAKGAPAKVMDVVYAAWSRYQQDHPRTTGGSSVFDQLYVGAYALGYDGILTLRGDLYRRYFETLKIVDS